ncbi:tetratricopeptide repeat protein [Leptospira sarikeiensis]|uniref:Tetratricopeptide repeat protein n=1 Tax=Leptospira sarikeiensis TaxID=2484943 RepID=A0A4R9KBL6_9LEPT|nr:hypothetical protein [Leptospira sarikeiensis]TGL63255.1 hypothetical protein EHQ64_04635 [Leptospira sarikeiensis]
MKIRLRILTILSLLLWGTYIQAQQDTFRLDNDSASVANSINVEVLKDGKSVRISWEPPRETGEIIVARSSSIIDNPEKCYISDSLGKFPSGVGNSVNQIYDYNLKPGTYYYAVILAHHVRKKDVKLAANRNYTTIPIVIENNPPPQTNNNYPPANTTNNFPPANTNQPPPEEQKYLSDNARVTDISVKREGQYLRISWEPYPKGIQGETIYTIYKSAEPMSSMSLMRKAEKLAEVSHPENSFLDQDLTKSQTLYYGVSVKQGLKEVLPLVQNQSFIRQFYVFEQDKRKPPKESDEVTNPQFAYDEMHVKDLKATSVDGGVRLDWKAPDRADENTIYSIYQAIKPLSGGVSTFLGGNVKKLGEVGHPDTNVMVRMKPYSGAIYFGVTVKRGDLEDFTLTLDESFVAIGSGPAGPSEDNSNNQTADNNEKPKNDSNNNNNGNQDQNNQNNQNNQQNNQNGQNDQRQPLIVEQEEPSNEEIDRVLKDTYWKNEYGEAVKQLAAYASSNDIDIRGKAKFFLGMSFYRKGEYNKALKFFVQKDTKNYNPERTEFWTKQCLARIGGGRR